MAPDPATTGTARIRQAIKTIRARIHSPDHCDRELTIALLAGRDADVTPSPDFPDAGLPARMPQRTVQAASRHVRRLCLAGQPESQPSRPRQQRNREERRPKPAMFDHLTDDKLRAAHDAARLLCDNHHELRLDPHAAIKLDTLTADITAELENRASRATQPDQRKPAAPSPAA